MPDSTTTPRQEDSAPRGKTAIRVIPVDPRGNYQGDPERMVRVTYAENHREIEVVGYSAAEATAIILEIREGP